MDMARTVANFALPEESEEQRVLILRDLIGKLPQLKSVEMKDHLGVYILFPRKKSEVRVAPNDDTSVSKSSSERSEIGERGKFHFSMACHLKRW